MRNRIVFAILLFFCPFVLLSQIGNSEKQVFVYKTVKGHKIKANMFLPATDGLHPVVVYFHGGGFIFGNRDEGLNSNLRDKLLENNYAVVSADYRLAPETKLDEILKDVSDVVLWLKENGVNRFGIDPSRIAVAGGSAGGYLALSTGFNQKALPKAIVAVSTPTGFNPGNIQMGDLSVLNQPGPYDIVNDSIVSYGDLTTRMELWRFLARNRLSLYEIFGFDPAKEANKLEQFKLSTHIKFDYPPTLLVHARLDRLVDLGQVQEFYNFLQKQQVKSELFLVESGHSSEVLNNWPQSIDHIIMFLNDWLK